MKLLIASNIWRFRYLLLLLVWRDVKSRYKQALFGFSWAILTPAFQALVYWLVFGLVFKIPTGNIPYLPLVFSGFIFWNFFSQSVSSATLSITSNSNLVTKIAFPKEILIFSSILGRIPDLIASLAVLIIILIFYQINPSVHILWVIPLLLIEMVMASAVGMFFASLNVYFRDITAVVPILLMAWLFLTPVIYPLESIPQQYQLYAKLNPMTGILEGLRNAVLVGAPPDNFSMLLSIIITFIFVIFSYLLFKKLEKGFSDVV
ncbi:MAG: ABC transporter permease [Candidatus Curtissbacteria bacterium]|nr:ABC transporter permease [Candidatus Curtissbacteria bacterium]